jgi:UDPglucose--hexose-1-phosphate uridylyltransferase
MSELRKDPVVGRWVIIAPERKRQLIGAARQPKPPPSSGLCPFCPGQEDLTPPEIYVVRDRGTANTPGWALRVVPNLFAALRVEGELNRRGDGIYDRMAGVGAHEIVIETPAHDQDLADLSAAEVASVLWAWRERLRDLSGDLRLTGILAFHNSGAAAGATLDHPHSQIIATPVVPHASSEELAGAAAHYRARERCVYCDAIDQERKDGVRLISENGTAVALAPWASRVPFECVLLPTRHSSTFEDESQESLRSVAEVLRDTLRRIRVALEQPSYSVILHTAPLRERGLPHYHWHLEIVPALAPAGGFERGSGTCINPVAPEEAAAFLRKISDAT